MTKIYSNTMHGEADCIFNVGLRFETEKGVQAIYQLVSKKTRRAIAFLEYTDGELVKMGKIPTQDDERGEMIHYHDFKRDAELHAKTGRL